MERFAIINDKIRLNLYNICRLCGIDNPSKIKILDSLKIPNDSDEEPCLSKKIECVVGIKVKRNDQMPQSICTLCADKINDFFEYREMCGATNIQTRKLLGIPLEITKRKKVTNDKEIKLEGESILGLGIEDDDITDNKSSVKLGKHRVKGRQTKKKGNNSKKKVYFKDEDVKVEEEIKTEIQPPKINNKNSKRLKIDLKKKVDQTPLLTNKLLTLKEPNKRERRREIDAQKMERRRIREEQRREIEEKKREIELAKQILEQKKLEKKRKRKSSDQEPPVKKLKQEQELDITSRHSCSICSESFLTNDLLSTHLHQSHTVAISSYGCSSCAESFKSLNEEKDHELWHSLSKTSYICPICNVAFEKTSIFTRHITLCKPFNLTPTVTNIHCEKCSKEFLTQNLYQWHSCFVKPNGKCWHCNRIFVKASTLFKHSFKCSNQMTDSQPKDPVVNVAMNEKRSRKIRSIDRESHIKSEPEANLDMDVSVSHMLTSNMLPVVVLTKTIFKPNQPLTIHDGDMSINVKTENEIDFEDNMHMDEPFRDADDSDDNDEAEPEPEQINGVESAMDATEEFSDDDVILIENNEEPVIVENGSPSGTRNTTEKPFVLPIVIKREPVDNYGIIAPPHFDPAKKIKTEPVDENSEACNELEKQLSPKRSYAKNRRSKKSTHKPYKEKQQLVHIKEEPVDADDLRNDIFRMAPSHNLGSAIVSLPTTNLLETTIKQEPIRPGYDDDFDPVLAMNIKKEPGLEDSSSSRLPSLRLIISKKHGTLNAKLISAQGRNTENVETSPKPTKTKRVKDKRLYKKPALLAERIRQEMIARMGVDKENATTNEQGVGNSNDFTVPVIARVLDATTISDLPYRVKLEPKSPCHSSEPILDSLPEEEEAPFNVNSFHMNPVETFNYGQFNEDKDATQVLSSNENVSPDAADSTMEVFNSFETSIKDLGTVDTKYPTGEESVNVLEATADKAQSVVEKIMDIGSVCGVNPTNNLLTNKNSETNVFSETNSYGNASCDGLEFIDQSASTKEYNSDDAQLHDHVNRISSYESNGHIAFESTDSMNQLCNASSQSKCFGAVPLNANYDHLTDNSNTFKIPNSYEAIDEIINTLPLTAEENVEKEDLSINSNNQSNIVVSHLSNTSDILSPKEITEELNSVLHSDSSESNSDKVNDSNVNTHSSSESHLENPSICNDTPENEKFKSTDEFRRPGGELDIENELLKSPVNENSDYELNSVQTLTTSAIHEQLSSLLEEISDDSLSCDIDLDDKTVDWEWESKLLGD